MRLYQIGEFSLIDRLRKAVQMRSNQVLLGIGDDAAVLRAHPQSDIILTTDALIEGVHFDLEYTPLESLGWKALAVNLSDIAAMGGSPLGATVSIAIPDRWRVEDVENLYAGLSRCAKTFRCPIVGGDTSRSLDGCFLSIAIAGETGLDQSVRRSGARVGDILCLTGEMGGAKTGLEALIQRTGKRRFKKSIRRFLEPIPRLEASSLLIRRLPVSSMIDVSDGLASEIQHLCMESDVGCSVDEERIPVSSEAIRWAKEQHKPLSSYRFESGEEYELLFTLPRKAVEKNRIFHRLAQSVSVSIIGEITVPSRGVQIRRRKKTVPMDFHGWNHFGKPSSLKSGKS
jgi:thiamine-monophosphate kinase